MSDETPVQEPIIISYVCENAPIAYIGEAMEGQEGKNEDCIYLSRALILGINPQTKEKFWTRPLTAGKDSIIEINTRTVVGVLVITPDEDMVRNYRNQFLQMFSKIVTPSSIIS